MDITLVTTASTDDEGRALLRRLGFPFADASTVAVKPRKKTGPGPRSGKRG